MVRRNICDVYRKVFADGASDPTKFRRLSVFLDKAQPVQIDLHNLFGSSL